MCAETAISTNSIMDGFKPAHENDIAANRQNVDILCDMCCWSEAASFPEDILERIFSEMFYRVITLDSRTKNTEVQPFVNRMVNAMWTNDLPAVIELVCSELTDDYRWDLEHIWPWKFVDMLFMFKGAGKEAWDNA